MKHALLVLLVFPMCLLHSQPLNGSHTIGGTSPSFATLQDAANALKARGVSGPTFFNIRPGTYSRNGGNYTVLLLDSIVAGLSQTNRITFQPDQTTGGNVDNVILQMNVTDLIGSRHDLVVVNLDHITFHNLTLKQIDTVRFGLNVLVQLQAVNIINPTVDGIVFEGCKLVGASPFGTQFGIEFGGSVRDITIRGNTFVRLHTAVSGFDGTSNAQGTITIEDNQFLAGWSGSAMEVFGENLIIQRNIIDFTGGFNGGVYGIFVYIPVTSTRTRIERNLVRGTVAHGLRVEGAVTVIPDSLLIANNMINTSGTTGLSIVFIRNAKILFNTVVLRGGGLTGLNVIGQDCIVLNNIIIVKATSSFNVCYNQGNNSTNLQSDYNVIYMELVAASGPLVVRNSVGYPTLAAYQAATGLDTNSISKDIDFVASDDLHLTDCQSQDPDLRGIPVPGITVDIDGEIRSTTTPMIGADENSVRMLDMFADPFRVGLAGTAFSVAAGRFDNILFDGLAVPDYDNRQVRLYHNLGGPRSFVQSGTLPTGFKPNVVKFFDLDHDNHLDLIVGGDTTALKVFWGDGFGNFPSDTTIITVNTIPALSGGRVRSLDTGRVSFVLSSTTILITEDDGFLPNTSYLAYLGSSGRNVTHFVIKRPGPGFTPDTIPAVLSDFIVGDLDGNGDPELAALTITPLPPSMYVFNDTNAQGGGGLLPYGTRYRYQLGTGSSPGHASSIIMGNFDGDTDNDLITLGSFSSCVLIRNQGSFTFSPEPISVSGAQALVKMDYENDGDLDFVTLNEPLETNGITVFLNDGTGNFIPKENCFLPFASGRPFGAIASDFDQDGRTDIAIVAQGELGRDSLFVLYNLGGGLTGVDEPKTIELPTGFELSQNYPNPFNPSTRIEYALPAQSHVSIRIYNLLGQEVTSLVDEEQTSGRHSIEWNGKSISGFAMGSGVYFYRMVARTQSAQNFIGNGKMMLLK